MTIPEQPTGGAAGAPAPSIPTAPPPIPGVSSTVPEGSALAAPTADAPFIPQPVVHTPTPVAPIEFDARAMVESQQNGKAEPAYGAMPKASAESEQAARKLRDQARKKRKRNQWFGWVFAVSVVALVVAGGYFAYTEFQRDDGSDSAVVVGQNLAEELFPQVIDENDDPAALTPVGEQVEVLEAMEPLNNAAVPSAGGLGSAIDDARDAVGQINDGNDEAVAGGAPAGPVTLAVVLPAWVKANGERLPDTTGREVYSVSAAAFSAGAPDDYRAFVRALSALPQRSPGDQAFAPFPPAGGDEIVIAVDGGDTLGRVVVRSTQPPIHVDHSP